MSQKLFATDKLFGGTKKMGMTPRILVSISLVLVGLVPAARADDVASLIKQLGAWSNNKAKKASDELTAMGKPVVPQVAKALSSSSRRRGRFAARTLRQIGQDAAGAIPELCESLEDSDALTREYAVEALATMTAHAEKVIDALQRATNDTEENVREKARLAIAQLTESLKSRDQTEPPPQPAAETPSAEPAPQPNTAEAGNSSAVLAAPSAKKESLLSKLTPIIFIRFALIAFIVVGFFSLLYVNREHP
jgi:HEAT repeat protein